MSNLSDERLKQHIDNPLDNGLSRSEVMESIRELLALREAGKEPDGTLINEGTMFKPVADLFAFKAPSCREWAFTEDAESIPEMVRLGWPVMEYVTLERFQQAYAAPQLPAVPDSAEQRLASAVELLKQATPHMLVDESMKDPGGALCGKLRAVPDGWVMVPTQATAEMISSGISAHYDRSKIQIHDRPAAGPMECAYAAMIAAAPKPE